MFHFTWITAAIACVAAMPQSTAPPAQPPMDARPTKDVWSITAEHLYNGVNRPVMILIHTDRDFGSVNLVLMGHDGTVLSGPVSMRPGRHDLAEIMPAVWDIRAASYLQLLDGHTPVGTPLVLQPMLSRMVPLTQVAFRPDGVTRYSKIIGFRDENTPESQAPPPPPPSAPATTTSTAPGEQSTSGSETDPNAAPATTLPASPATAAAQEPTEPTSIPRLFTGLRIYPEQDVVLHTVVGDIRVALRPDEAPNTSWNFLDLARGGFYDGIVFHRVVPMDRTGQPFVIQAGDPAATGDGGPGYWLPMEDSRLPHDFGVISMARSDDPDSAGSQFFFCLSRTGTARLDGQYCSFGYAVDGAAAIKDIADMELADVAAGRPRNPPMIERVDVIDAPPRTPGTGKGRPDHRVTEESVNARPEIPRNGRVPR